jgi:hypothetical protein
VKDLDDTKAPLLDHLTELRTRLLWSIAVLVFLFIGSWFFAQQIFGFLVQPLIEAGQGRVIFTDVFEAFFVDVKVALFTALMIGFPILRDPDLEVRRPRPLRPGKAGPAAVPACDSGVLHRRSGLRLLHRNAGGASLPAWL